MSVIERIKEQISTMPVILYMKGSPDAPMCGFSARAVECLKAEGRPFAYFNVLQDPEVRAELPKYADWPTFPQLWINQELIGGCDIIEELHESGELSVLLQDVVWPEQAD